MTAARRLRDLWLAGADAPAASPAASDEPTTDEDAASDEERAPEDVATATEEHVTQRRRPCVPRRWYGPSSKR